MKTTELPERLPWQAHATRMKQPGPFGACGITQTHQAAGTRRSGRLCSILAILGILTSMAHAADQMFYRLLSAETNATIRLSPGGTLMWRCSTTGGTYVVERSRAMSSPKWTPYARGIVTQTAMSLRVYDPATPPGMVFVPSGFFTMGDILNDGAYARPVHTAQVGAIYIQIHDVSNEEARRVFQWAYDRDKCAITSHAVRNKEGDPQDLLVLDALDSGLRFSENKFVLRQLQRTNHPCVWVTWYGAVTYCNFLSQMEGREVCYNLTNWSCDFARHGYRLPSEAEWEKAARGGSEGRRFPWSDSDVISHERANYYSRKNVPYDVSLTPDYHPGVQSLGFPFTNAAGTFAPNDFGLEDMAGNVWQWCWDFSNTWYEDGTAVDPTGPKSGTRRIFRGGSWMTSAERTICAVRYLDGNPVESYRDIGFRIVLRATP